LIEFNFVAWWGAIVAKVVLVWDIIKWSSNRPKIRINTQMPTSYSDSERVETKTPGGETVTELKTNCHIELINQGEIPTTIISVCCSNKPTKNKGEHSSHNITILNGNSLPHTLGSGELWSCRIPESSVQNIASLYSSAYVKVRLSHKVRPIYAKIKNHPQKACA
jgi:hypothetical protein